MCTYRAEPIIPKKLPIPDFYCISPIIPAYLTYYSLIIPVAIHYKSGIKTVITKPENDDEILFLLINILHRN
jgi:hypothetical protein